MRHFTAFDPATGKIIARLSGDIVNAGEHDIVEEYCDDIDAYYVDGGSRKLVIRPTLNVVVSAKTIKLSESCFIQGVPSGATCSIDGVDHTCDGQPIHFTADHAGSYTLAISYWPYRELYINITAEEDNTK